MREWQQTRFKNICMPDAVYYQTLWAVRDLYRMEDRVQELDREITQGDIGGASIVSSGSHDYGRVKPAEKLADEKMRLETRIRAIRGALEVVPVDYRSFILDHVIYQAKKTDVPSNIWRVWKQKFLFHVAKNLALV